MPNQQSSTAATFPASGGRPARIGDRIVVRWDDPATGGLIPAIVTAVDNNGVTGWVAPSRPDIVGGTLAFDTSATGLADLASWKWIFDPTALVRTTAPAPLSSDGEIAFAGDFVRLLPSTSGWSVYGINITANPAADGQEICIRNAGADAVTLVHDSASASAGSKLFLASGADHDIEPGEMLWAIYVDSTSESSAKGWHVDDAGQPAPAHASATGSTSAPTTTSGTPAVVAEMTVDVDTTGGSIFATFSGSFLLQDGDDFTVTMYLDGSPIAGTARGLSYTSSQGALDPAASITQAVSISAFLPSPSAGAHTVAVYWSATSGTARAVTTQRRLDVIEYAA